MDSEQERQVASFLSGLFLGAVIGAGVALLTTPQSGRRTRRRIRRVAGGIRDTATDRLDDLADDLKGRVDDAVQESRRRLGR